MGIRWVGGKHFLVERLMQFFPAVIRGVYVEPFLGGGHVAERVSTQAFGGMLLSDACDELVMLHKVLTRADGIETLKRIVDTSMTIESREDWIFLNESEPQERHDTWRAARLLVLIYKSFCGKLNWRKGYSRGQAWQAPAEGNDFNIPWKDLAHLGLSLSRAGIRCLRWQDALETHPVFCKDALVYLDPPYLNPEDGISERPYSSAQWRERDLKALVARAEAMHKNGAAVILSEHDSWKVRAMLDTRKWSVHKVEVHRSFSRNGSRASEIIATLGLE